MDETLLNRIVQLTKSNPNVPRILSRDLPPVLQHALISSPNAGASNVFISGIPYALDRYAVFSRSDRDLPAPPNGITSIIAFILS
jgi:hypothetical protein